MNTYFLCFYFYWGVLGDGVGWFGYALKKEFAVADCLMFALTLLSCWCNLLVFAFYLLFHVFYSKLCMVKVVNLYGWEVRCLRSFLIMCLCVRGLFGVWFVGFFSWFVGLWR